MILLAFYVIFVLGYMLNQDQDMKLFNYLLIILPFTILHGSMGITPEFRLLADSSITYSFINGDDSIPQQKTYKYKVNDSTIITSKILTNNKWINNIKIAYTEDKNCSKAFNYSWNASHKKWQAKTLIQKEFSLGNTTRFSQYSYCTDINEWVSTIEIQYFYNTDFAIDSIYTLVLNADSTDLVFSKKEIRLNSYDKPIQSLHYNYATDNSWQLTGKTEYMYYENGHDITNIYYNYNNDYQRELMSYKDFNSDGSIAYKEDLKWDNEALSWTKNKLFIKESPNTNKTIETSYAYHRGQWLEETKTIILLDDYLNATVIENYRWKDSITAWHVEKKTYNKQLTANSISKNNTIMNEQVLLDDRSIIIKNDSYANSNYSLYSLNGLLLQKGTLDQQMINVDPQIEEQTVVLVLMNHSKIFSRKIQFMH